MADDKPLQLFEGIQPEKERKEKEGRVLETLIGSGYIFVEQFSKSHLATPPDEGVYQNMYTYVSNILKDIQFDEGTLKDYVFSGFNFEGEYDERMALGCYTGCLLQLLTERNRAEGKKTSIYINGGGAKFDYLFFCAKYADEVIVDNFRGYGICGAMGRNKGDVGSIALVNSNVESAFIRIGENYGAVDLAVLVNCEGDGSAFHAAECGKLNSVFIINCLGKHQAYNVGRSTITGVNHMLLLDTVGDFAAENIGSVFAHMEELLIVGCKGAMPLKGYASIYGKIDTVLVADFSDTDMSIELNGNADVNPFPSAWPEPSPAGVILNPDSCGKLYVHNSLLRFRQELERFNIIRDEEAGELYIKMMEKYQIEEMRWIAVSIKDAKPEVVIAGVNRIMAIHESIMGEQNAR